jgi:transposase
MVAARDHERAVLRAAQRSSLADVAKGFPPVSTVQRYFCAWRDSGVWITINPLLLMTLRLAAGRQASPSAGVIIIM